jgi:hypothetical protein
MSGLDINTVRCEALFASTLQRSQFTSVAQLHEAIRMTVRELGSRGCAARVAQEFGDHPDEAVARMCWVRGLVAEVFDRHRPEAVPVDAGDADDGQPPLSAGSCAEAA